MNFYAKYTSMFIIKAKYLCSTASFIKVITSHISPPPYGRTSRVWDSLFVMKSGCAGGRGFAPRPGQYSKESFSSNQETGKVFSPEMPLYSKF